MRRAIIAATVYFLILFALGFILGTFRVLVVEPRFGALVATVIELPFMLSAAYFVCRRIIGYWTVRYRPNTRWAMTFWFLALLFVFETLLGALLFGRTMVGQWATLGTPAGILGLLAQVVAALLPVFMGTAVNRTALSSGS